MYAKLQNSISSHIWDKQKFNPPSFWSNSDSMAASRSETGRSTNWTVTTFASASSRVHRTRPDNKTISVPTLKKKNCSMRELKIFTRLKSAFSDKKPLCGLTKKNLISVTLPFNYHFIITKTKTSVIKNT